MSAVLGRKEHDPYVSRVYNTPHIADRVDPVVYAPAGKKGPLTREQVRQYDRDGFLELDGLFSAAEINTLVAELDRLREAPVGINRDTLILEPDSEELRSIFAIHAQSLLFARLAADERLAGIARYLLGDEVYIHQSRLNYKPGFFGKEFYWHSDFETWHVEDGMPRMRALSMSISLTQNTEYNGPLMIIPGSHRRYVRCVGATPDDHYKQSLRRQEYGVPDPESLQSLFEEGGIATTKGSAGKVVLFDCNSMHGSNSNISPLPRSNVFLVYNSVTNRVVTPFGGKPPRPEFIATRKSFKPIQPVGGSFV
ncbi:MAG: ectoine hydroxylase [Xanthomonadaceae bacterium]|nr:ectoine hydroxylase [Xanthomonadaceae bacterium]